MYQIREMLIDKTSGNRPGVVITPKGIVSHRTADPGASAQAVRNFFNTKRLGAESSAHYVVDSKEIIRCVPENEKAYHCAKGMQNTYAIGIELCEPLTRDAYLRYVWLHANICLRHDWVVAVIYPHSHWDPVNRPNDTGDLFDWKRFINDVKYLVNEGRKQKGLSPKISLTII